MRSMRRLLPFLTALLALTIPSWAGFGLHGSTPVLSCPYSATASADGCAAIVALGGGSVQYPNFFTASSTATSPYGIARQALPTPQTYLTRAPWNVAGVDYAVGPLLTKAATFKNPTVAGNWAGTNCSPGTVTSSGAPVVVCCASNSQTYVNAIYTGITCSGVSLSALTIDDFDFSAGSFGGNSCIPLRITNTAVSGTGTLTITNNKWVAADDGATDNCNQSGVYISYLGSGAASNTNLVFEYNWIDGKADTSSPNQFAGASFNFGGTLTIEYNAILHINNRPFSDSLPATSSPAAYSDTIFANYIDGFVFTTYTNFEHGELLEITMGSSGNASSTFTDSYTYNTINQPNTVGTSSTTSLIYVSSGNPSGQLSNAFITRDVTIDHNVLVSSAQGGAVSTLIEQSYAYYAAPLTITNNYIDTTGAGGIDDCNGAPYVSGVYAGGTYDAMPSTEPTWGSGATANVYLTSGNPVPLTIGPGGGGNTFQTYQCPIGNNPP